MTDLDELLADADLDPENDLAYLVALASESIDDTDSFETDRERAEWAVAQWCQELGFVPDLSDYTAGETVGHGEQRGLPDPNTPTWEGR